MMIATSVASIRELSGSDMTMSLILYHLCSGQLQLVRIEPSFIPIGHSWKCIYTDYWFMS